MKLNWNNFHLYGDFVKKNELRVENPQEQMANAILDSGRGIAAYDLAQKVYNDNGETEYNDRESAVIEGLLQTLPTKWAIALKDIIVKE